MGSEIKTSTHTTNTAATNNTTTDGVGRDDFIGGIEDLANVAFTPAKLVAGIANNAITTAGSTVNNTVNTAGKTAESFAKTAAGIFSSPMFLIAAGGVLILVISMK